MYMQNTWSPEVEKLRNQFKNLWSKRPEQALCTGAYFKPEVTGAYVKPAKMIWFKKSFWRNLVHWDKNAGKGRSKPI